MLALNVNNAKNNFLEMFDKAVRKSEITEITSSYGSAVLIDKNTWESMNETILLLNDKRALKALLEGQESRKNGTIEGKTIEEVFPDL